MPSRVTTIPRTDHERQDRASRERGDENGIVFYNQDGNEQGALIWDGGAVFTDIVEQTLSYEPPTATSCSNSTTAAIRKALRGACTLGTVRSKRSDSSKRIATGTGWYAQHYRAAHRTLRAEVPRSSVCTAT